ncbi:MAG: hypothetical protein NDI75_14285 [Candidatus Didemnitutus sp.]|nr:hypothetical protein [Candidatus Didemnitutus sp.]
MSNLLQRVLSAPQFPDDPRRARKGRLFNLCFWFCNVLVWFTVVGNLIGGQIPWVVTSVSVAGLALGPLLHYWAHHGRLELASGTLLALLFIALTTACALLGTIRVPSSAYFVVLVVISGLLFERRGLLLMTVLSSAAIGGLILAENAGALPRPDYRVTITQWISMTALLACVGGLTLSALESIRELLGRAEHEIAERHRAEEALRRANAELQEALASVKTLTGLLPVCAWCRKVREDDGYWSALESYVAARTDATFTHGICPECQAKQLGTLSCRSVPSAGSPPDPV